MFFSSAEKSRQGSFPHHFLLLVGIRIQPTVLLTLKLLVSPLKFLIQLCKGLTWESACSSKFLAHADTAGQGPHFGNHCATTTREVVSGFIATESKKKKKKNLKSPAAAKLLQSYLTLCNPIDGSPPGSPVPSFYKRMIDVGTGMGLDVIVHICTIVSDFLHHYFTLNLTMVITHWQRIDSSVLYINCIDIPEVQFGIVSIK